MRPQCPLTDGPNEDGERAEPSHKTLDKRRIYTHGRAHVKIHQSTYKTKTDERQDRWRADVHLYLTVLLHKENEYNLSFLFCPALFVLSSDIWRNYKLKCPFFYLFGRHFWIFFFFLCLCARRCVLRGKSSTDDRRSNDGLNQQMGRFNWVWPAISPAAWLIVSLPAIYPYMDVLYLLDWLIFRVTWL